RAEAVAHAARALHQQGGDRGLPVPRRRAAALPAGGARVPSRVPRRHRRMWRGRAAGRIRRLPGAGEGGAPLRARRLQADVPGDVERLHQPRRHLRAGLRRRPRHLRGSDAGRAAGRDRDLHRDERRGDRGVPGDQSGLHPAPTAVRHRRTGDRRGMPRRSARGRGARARGVRRALRELRPRLSAAGGGVVTLRRAARVAALLLMLAARSVAAEEASPAWQFEVMPYAWIPGTFGSIKVKGRTAAVDTTMGDVLTLLWHGDAFTAGGYFAARYDRWSGFLDAY